MSDDIDLADASDILGMANLLNNSEIDNSLKPKNIEKELIQNSLEFDSIINHNQDLLNYNPINEYNEVIDNIIDNKHNSDNQYDNNDNYTDNNSSSGTNDNDNDDDVSEIDELINLSSNNSNNNSLYNSNYNKPYDTNSFSYKLTQEQKNQKLVDNVLSVKSDANNDNLNFNIDDENREDLKVSLLEKIDNLMEELEDDGISLDKIPRVDYNTDLEKIEANDLQNRTMISIGG